MQLLGCFGVCRKSFPAHAVLENCQHTESGVLGQHLQQRDAGVSGGKCSLHGYPLSLPSLPQVLQRGTSVHLGSISWKCALEHK